MMEKCFLCYSVGVPFLGVLCSLQGFLGCDSGYGRRRLKYGRGCRYFVIRHLSVFSTFGIDLEGCIQSEVRDLGAISNEKMRYEYDDDDPASGRHSLHFQNSADDFRCT